MFYAEKIKITNYLDEWFQSISESRTVFEVAYVNLLKRSV